jgi:hypothetical protein
MVSELGKRMLIIVAKRGYTGASREVFFQHIRGIKYIKLEKAVLALEKEELIHIEWVGPSNFTVSITPKGVEIAKGYQEDVWKKSAEALEKVQSTKHTEKSIMHDDMEYSRAIDDKMHVSEVGSVADEIIKQIDKQILDERAHSAEGIAEEEVPVAVAVPAWEETVSPGEAGVDKDAVERRISGEIKTEVAEGGRMIPLETGEDSTVDRIESDDHSFQTKVKEKRISGDMDQEGEEEEEEEKKGPPRPPRSFLGSTDNPVYEEPREIYSEEDAEVDAQAEMETPYAEGTFDEDTYEEPQESAQTYDEAPEPETDTMPGFSLEELMADDDEAKPSEETETEDITSTSAGALCMWEPENECPILKAGETEIIMDQCIICQLIQVKQMLQNR